MVSEEAWATGGHVAVTLIFKIREASLLEIHVTSVEGKRYFESIPTLWEIAGRETDARMTARNTPLTCQERDTDTVRTAK